MPILRKARTRNNVSMPIPLLPANERSRVGTESVWEPDEFPPAHLAVPAVPLHGFVPKSPSLEEMQLVQRMFFLSGEDIPRIIVFCGVEAGDGSETLCARTGEVLSCLLKESVCIMDANPRAPTLHLRYDIDDDGSAFGRRALDTSGDRTLMEPNLWVLPAGSQHECRSEFAPDQMRQRLTVLREKFGFLLVSAPPLAKAADGYLLGQMADGVVLSILARSTQREAAIKVRRNLDHYNVHFLGAVLNEPPRGRQRAKSVERD